MRRILLCALFTATAALAAEYQVGIATAVITPAGPIYMSGYASRKHPSEGVLQDLKAKAMVIRHRGGSQAAIVTMDLIGLPRSISDVVAARIEKQYGIERARLLLNCSHTHTGPMVRQNLEIMFDLTPQDRQVVDDYARNLTDTLVNLVGAAAGKLQPANLWFGNGQAHFGVNRRQPSADGVKIGLNPNGPSDPDVPILKVTAPDGKLRAVLFGYACHNTTLTGEFYRISGDYAGFAQAGFERTNPGATAMFMQLCGADQNPNPRSTLEYAERHGAALAAEVSRVAGAKLSPVRGPVRAAFQIVDLPFAYHTRSTFEARLQDKNIWRVRNAKNMLRTYDENRPIRSYPYPVQAITLGKDVTLVALGGEVVIDYCLRVKKEYGAKGIMVAGYSNDVMSYIPSARILKEGGYEAEDSMIYYGLPGRYADDVEDRIFDSLHKLMPRVGRKAAR
jgi:hypothetical protein